MLKHTLAIGATALLLTGCVAAPPGYGYGYDPYASGYDYGYGPGYYGPAYPAYGGVDIGIVGGGRCCYGHHDHFDHHDFHHGGFHHDGGFHGGHHGGGHGGGGHGGGGHGGGR